MSQHEKIPPQALDLEKAVLGALMIDKESINEIATFLRAEMFYKEAHQTIYKTIFSLFQENRNIDMLIVSQALNELNLLNDVGGAYYISQLTQDVASSAHIVEHAHHIQRAYLLRTVITQTHEAQVKAYDNDYSVIDDLSINLEAINKEIEGVRPQESFVENVAKVRKDFVDNNGKGITGILTGLGTFDKQMRGFDKGDLIVLAGRPGMGKTSFALDIANKIRENVLFFSLEMSTASLIKRKVKAKLDYEVSERFELNNATDTDMISILNAFDEVGNDNMLIDDGVYMTPDKIRAKSKIEMLKQDIDLIIIDYLQLMTDVGKDKNAEVGNITRKLKLLAKELNVPIILLSQLNRAVESRGDKYPMLSDLRDSGSIEQDADIVLFCYRPEYYGFNEIEINGVANTDSTGCFVLDFAKYREGQTGKIYLKANKNITCFGEWEQPESVF